MVRPLEKILLQKVMSVMVSPGIHLVKTHEFLSSPEPMSPSLKKKSEIENDGHLCNQKVNLKRDSKLCIAVLLKLKLIVLLF